MPIHNKLVLDLIPKEETGKTLSTRVLDHENNGD